MSTKSINSEGVLVLQRFGLVIPEVPELPTRFPVVRGADNMIATNISSILANMKPSCRNPDLDGITRAVRETKAITSIEQTRGKLYLTSY